MSSRWLLDHWLIGCITHLHNWNRDRTSISQKISDSYFQCKTKIMWNNINILARTLFFLAGFGVRANWWGAGNWVLNLLASWKLLNQSCDLKVYMTMTPKLRKSRDLYVYLMWKDWFCLKNVGYSFEIHLDIIISQRAKIGWLSAVGEMVTGSLFFNSGSMYFLKT